MSRDRPNFGWDLPPGVRESDIPGNRPEDIRMEQLYESAAWGDVMESVQQYIATARKRIAKLEIVLATLEVDNIHEGSIDALIKTVEAFPSIDTDLEDIANELKECRRLIHGASD